MEAHIKDSSHVLRRFGTRVTPPRLAVLNCLTKSPKPLSPKEVQQLIPEVDSVSVYRTLMTLVKIGVAHQVFPSGHFVACRFLDNNDGLHLLLKCSVCERSEEVDIPNDLLSSLNWYLRDRYHFESHNGLIQIDGACSQCKS